MLVSEVIERVRNELLFSGGAGSPTWDKDSDGTDTSTLTLNLTGRISNVPAGSILEWDDDTMELAPVDSVAGSTATLFSRGYLETTAATHTTGTRVFVNNPFSKIVLYNALVTLIRSLRAFDIYNRTVDTSKTLSTLAPVALDSTAYDTAGDIWWKSGNRWQRLRRSLEYEVLYDVSPIEVQFWVGQSGASLRLPYKRDFTVPTALSDNLSSLTVPIPESLQPHLPKGIAAMVLTGRDIPHAHSQHIRTALEREGTPVGTFTSLARAMQAEWLNAVTMERSRQQLANPIQTEFIR